MWRSHWPPGFTTVAASVQKIVVEKKYILTKTFYGNLQTSKNEICLIVIVEIPSGTRL